MCYDDDTVVSVLGCITGGIGGKNIDLSFCAIDEMSLSITSYCLTVWANFIAPGQRKIKMKEFNIIWITFDEHQISSYYDS